MDINPLELLSEPRRERLSGQIASQIKKLIFSKKIELGQKMPTERELADSLNVSRVVIREALRSLEQAGFIETKPGHAGGSFVSNKVYKPLFNSIYDLFDNGDLTLEHFYQSRREIECLSIKLAIDNIEAHHLEELDAINRKLLDDIKDNASFHYHNMDFHVKIADISGNPLVKLIVAALLNILIIIYPIPTQSSEFIEKTFRRHEAIMEAMRKRDKEECHRLIAKDVEFTKKMIE